MKKINTAKNLESGFAHALILFVIALAAVGFIGWRAWDMKKDANFTDRTSSEESAEQPAELIWQQIEGGWQAMETPPDCPVQPIMVMPAELSKVTGILYPGQTRGGNYKPHGGFRFDNSVNSDIKVTAPIEGFIVRGGRYIEDGEVQYMFDVMNNCGVMYRVDHLEELPDNLKKIADTWPEPQDGDSRTQRVDPAVYVKRGEILATSVGIVRDKNTFFDWGVYDYRQENEASKSTLFQQRHAQDKELSWHSVCWFDWLASDVEAKLRSLPAGDPTSGKTSDYCKN